MVVEGVMVGDGWGLEDGLEGCWVLREEEGEGGLEEGEEGSGKGDGLSLELEKE